MLYRTMLDDVASSCWICLAGPLHLNYSWFIPLCWRSYINKTFLSSFFCLLPKHDVLISQLNLWRLVANHGHGDLLLPHNVIACILKFEIHPIEKISIIRRQRRKKQNNSPPPNSKMGEHYFKVCV